MSVGLTELGLAVLAGGLTTLSPCVLPILPLIVGGAVQRNRFSPVVMAAGLVTSFALIGLLVGVLGDALSFDSDVIRIMGAWFLIIFGLVMIVPHLSQRLSSLLTPVANSANQIGSRLNHDSIGGIFILGATLGMVWSPCSGPLLASALTLVASEGGALRGAFILGLFGIGAAIPMIIIAYASRMGFNRMRDRILNKINGLKRIFGILIIWVGISILMGWDKQIEAYFVQNLPESWVNLTVLF